MPEVPPYMVSLYLYGDQLDPEHITALLATAPTRGWMKGGKKDPKKEYRGKTGVWHLKAISTSSVLDDHIKELLDKLQNRSVEQLRDIPTVEAAKIDIYVIEPYAEQPKEICFAISAKVAKAVAVMEVDIVVTVGRITSPD